MLDLYKIGPFWGANFTNCSPTSWGGGDCSQESEAHQLHSKFLPQSLRPLESEVGWTTEAEAKLQYPEIHVSWQNFRVLQGFATSFIQK